MRIGHKGAACYLTLWERLLVTQIFYLCLLCGAAIHMFSAARLQVSSLPNPVAPCILVTPF